MKALVCRSLLALGLFVSSVVALPALAQTEPDPAAERSEAFEAATGAQTENVPGGLLMVTAYGAVFLLLLGYVVSLGFRQVRTQRELERLRDEILTHARTSSSGERPPEEF